MSFLKLFKELQESSLSPGTMTIGGGAVSNASGNVKMKNEEGKDETVNLQKTEERVLTAEEKEQMSKDAKVMSSDEWCKKYPIGDYEQYKGASESKMSDLDLKNKEDAEKKVKEAVNEVTPVGSSASQASPGTSTSVEDPTLDGKPKEEIAQNGEKTPEKKPPVQTPVPEPAVDIKPEGNKEYLGNNGTDTFFYFIMMPGATGGVSDLQVTDADGKVLFSATENQMDVADVGGFITRAMNAVKIANIAYDVVMKYLVADAEEDLVRKPGQAMTKTPESDVPLKGAMEPDLRSNQKESVSESTLQSIGTFIAWLDFDAKKTTMFESVSEKKELFEGLNALMIDALDFMRGFDGCAKAVGEAKFGTAEWQAEQMAKIKNKLDNGIPLDGSDEAFIETQQEFMNRVGADELANKWKQFDLRKNEGKRSRKEILKKLQEVMEIASEQMDGEDDEYSNLWQIVYNACKTAAEEINSLKLDEKHWMKDAFSKNKGGLHKALHVPADKNIPADKLDKATHSDDEHLRHMAQAAKNAKESNENKEETVKTNEDINKISHGSGKYTFYLVTDATPESELVDVISEVDAEALANIVIGTDQGAAGRFVSEHPQLYPAEKKEEAMADAQSRLQAAKTASAPQETPMESLLSKHGLTEAKPKPMGKIRVTLMSVDWKDNFNAQDISRVAKQVGGKGNMYDVDSGSDDKVILISSVDLTYEQIQQLWDAGDFGIGDDIFTAGSFAELVKKVSDNLKQSMEEAREIVQRNIAYDVFLNGKNIDRVFFAANQEPENVKKMLIDHDGYDPNIEVKFVQEKVSESAPPGGEYIVKKLKGKKDVNPYAIAWGMRKKGNKFHKGAHAGKKMSSVKAKESVLSTLCKKYNVVHEAIINNRKVIEQGPLPKSDDKEHDTLVGKPITGPDAAPSAEVGPGPVAVPPAAGVPTDAPVTTPDAGMSGPVAPELPSEEPEYENPVTAAEAQIRMDYPDEPLTSTAMAYADSILDNPRVYGSLRSLNWEGQYTNSETFLKQAKIVGHYNNFTPEIAKLLTDYLGDGAKYRLGRESSVVVYFTVRDMDTKVSLDSLRRIMHADEAMPTGEPGEARLWWD